jgi:hypothetical protein
VPGLVQATVEKNDILIGQAATPQGLTGINLTIWQNLVK